VDATEKGLAMTRAGEVITKVVDVTELSLKQLRASDDQGLIQSIEIITGRAQCSQTGVLQNQVREDI
jgi:hypothetical protein